MLLEVDRARPRTRRRRRLDHHVARRRETREQLAPGGAGEIERDAALAGVEKRMREAHALSRRPALVRGELAHRRAFRRLDAHDVGAEIGEQPAGIGGVIRGEIEHANAGERGRIGCGLHHQSVPSSLSRKASHRFISRSWRL